MNIYQWMLQFTRLTTTANVPPIVTVGAPQSISLPVSTATLTGAATDSLGTITSHIWTFVSGPTTAVIASPTSFTTTVTGLTAAGTYIFSLSSTDSRNLTVATNAQITVFPPPTGPNRLINVNLYGNSDPYGNSAWNDWNVGTTLTSNKFNYSDGSPSALSAVLSTQTAVACNGASYAGQPCARRKWAATPAIIPLRRPHPDLISGLDSTQRFIVSTSTPVASTQARQRPSPLRGLASS